MSKLPWSTNGIENACCCEEGCCLYPASGYGTLYGSDDLPDTIQPQTNGPILTKGGDSRPGQVYGSNATGDYVIAYITHNGGSAWNFESENGWTSDAVGCLASSLDQFPDFPETLYIGGNPLTYYPGETDCVWVGSAWVGGSLFDTVFIGYNATSCKWYCSGINVDGDDQFYFEKESPQNVPTGAYGAGAVTVSEA